MKLSKAQRLFIKIGRIEYWLNHIKRYYEYDKRNGLKVDCYADRMKELKEKRKKLIREALEASAEESQQVFDEGVSLGHCWSI